MTMLGFWFCAVPWFTPAASKKLKAAIGPRVHFRMLALKFIVISVNPVLDDMGPSVTISERSLKPNYSAPLNKAEADSIGGIFDNQVRCQLVAGQRGEVL
jgi:hypothetical protein